MNGNNFVYFLAGQSMSKKYLTSLFHLKAIWFTLNLNYQSINIQNRSDLWRSTETLYFKDKIILFEKPSCWFSKSKDYKSSQDIQCKQQLA